MDEAALFKFGKWIDCSKSHIINGINSPGLQFLLFRFAVIIVYKWNVLLFPKYLTFIWLISFAKTYHGFHGNECSFLAFLLSEAANDARIGPKSTNSKKNMTKIGNVFRQNCVNFQAMSVIKREFKRGKNSCTLALVICDIMWTHVNKAWSGSRDPFTNFKPLRYFWNGWSYTF